MNKRHARGFAEQADMQRTALIRNTAQARYFANLYRVTAR
jgi:hypothetical protein